MKFFSKKHHKLFVILIALLLAGGLIAAGLPKSVLATDYTISSDTTWDDASDVPAGIGNLTVNNGITLTVGGGAYDAGGFTVSGTGTLTVNGTISVYGEISGASGYGITFDFANITVANGGTINGDGKGFGASAGPGAGISGGSACTGGGGYGGNGGNGLGSCTGLALGGGTYGTNDTAPVNLGSGGGVAGGGAITITASGTTTVNGIISANGSAGVAANAGGGSGGSAYITTGTITGTGSITVNGGNASTNEGFGGGGGGGRVAIRYSTTNTFSVANATATAGTSVNGMSGSAGTAIFIETTNKDAYIYKTFEFSGARGVNADLTASSDGTYRFHNVVLGDASNNATVLAKGSGSSPSGIGPTLYLSGSFSLISGSTFSANGYGYAAETGPGAGQYNGSVCTGGGGYGGAGGAAGGSCAGVAIAGSAYGSAVSPTDLGSGASTAGGGAITINASSGTVTIYGNMTADGSNGSGSYGGGASGGSILITANTIAGSAGTITANGGNGVSFGGGGGGGRIAVYYITSNTFTGTRTVTGGTGNVVGSTGTNYLYAKAVSTPVSVDGVAVSGSTSSASITPAFIVTPTEAASNPLNVKIQIATDTGFTANVQTFDQSSSGTGWTNANTTPYATGTSVTYTVQSALTAKTTYYWRTAAKAPAGMNDWGDWSSTYSFLTNAKPQITSLTASQASTGEVNIAYTLSDEDDASATISFQYWDGAAYQEATTTTGEGSKTSGASPGTAQTGAWTAKTDYNNQYTTGMKIKVSANDGNVGGTNTAESSTFTLDTTNPSIASFSINSGATTINTLNSTLSLSATDNTAIQMQFSNDNSTWSDYEAYATSKTWTLASGSDGIRTVYLRIKDAKGNIATTSDTILYDVTFPTAAANLEIFDVSKTGGSGPYRHFVDWDTNADGDFSSYKVQKKVDSGSYSIVSTITNQSESHYFDDGLVNTSTYSYKITLTDLAANTTDSSVVSNQPASADITAPTITNTPSASSITTKAATVSWTTNENSNSIVDYGTTISYGLSAGNSAESVASHSVALTGLTPGATYYFRVKSADAAGNTGTADNSGAGYTFSATASPAISAVSSGTPGQTSAAITWTTTTASDSLIEWGTTASPDSSWKTSGNRAESVTSHSVSLTGLTANTTYYFQVKSRDSDANQTTANNSGAYYSFTTGSDTTAPVITDGPTASNVLNNSAVITWKTGEASTTRLSYSTTNGFTWDAGTQTTLQTETDYNHSVSLTNLIRNTTYYVLARSADSSSNTVTSSSVSFTTTGDATAPVISLTAGGSVAETSAVISWQTDEPATSQVYYATDAGNLSQSTVADSKLNRSHRVALSNLTSGATYYFQVVSLDANANSASLSHSQDNTLTFTALTTPSVSAVTVSNITATTASVAWTSNVAADSAVEFGASSTNLTNSQGNPLSAATSHSITLAGLSPSTTYYYRTKSIDANGNVAYSDTSTFTTLAEAGDSIAPSIAGDSFSVSTEAASAAVTWTTDEASNSMVAYGTAASYGSESGKDDAVTTHSVILNGLSPDTTYYYEMRSKDLNNNLGVSGGHQFTTKKQGAISEVKAEDISLTGAIISWTTNVVTTSILSYGTDKNALTPITDQSLGSTTSHTIKLSNLTEDTKYYFKVKGKDENANDVESDLYNFSTLPQPKATKITLGEVLARSAIISWQTNVSASSLVSFGANIPNQDQGSSELTTSHKVSLQALSPNTQYNYQIKSTDQYGNTAISETFTFTTKADIYPPEISQVKSEISTVGAGESARVQAIISWQTNEPSTSAVVFGIGVTSGDLSQKSPVDSNLNQSHLVVIRNLAPSTTYRFKVTSMDEVGNAASSSDYTILTPEQQASTLQIIIKLLEETFSFMPAAFRK